MYGRVYLRLMLYIQYVYTAQNLRYNNDDDDDDDDDDDILMTCRGPRGPNVKIHKHNKHKVIITGGCVVFS